MKLLQTLLGAGYRRGYNNGHGADDTVSSLEHALSRLETSPVEALDYGMVAANNLASRLFAGYAICSFAAINRGELEEAHAYHQKAEAVAALVGKDSLFEEPLALIERRLRRAKAALAAEAPHSEPRAAPPVAPEKSGLHIELL